MKHCTNLMAWYLNSHNLIYWAQIWLASSPKENNGPGFHMLQEKHQTNQKLTKKIFTCKGKEKVL